MPENGLKSPGDSVSGELKEAKAVSCKDFPGSEYAVFFLVHSK